MHSDKRQEIPSSFLWKKQFALYIIRLDVQHDVADGGEEEGEQKKWGSQHQ